MANKYYDVEIEFAATSNASSKRERDKARTQQRKAIRQDKASRLFQ